jgi:hypothetical protein
MISSGETGWEGVDSVKIGERSSRFRDARIPLSKTVRNFVLVFRYFGGDRGHFMQRVEAEFNIEAAT